MRTLHTLALAALLAATAHAADTTRKMVLTDGTNIWPANTIAPYSHTHTKANITDFPTTWAWSALTGVPSTFTPSAHTHTKAQITDFPTTWDWANITNKPTTFTPATHTHAIADITNLQTSLDAKAAKTHTHAIADTTGLQAALEALAPLSSVTCTTNAVTYIWQWDEEAGTFALVERE